MIKRRGHRSERHRIRIPVALIAALIVLAVGCGRPGEESTDREGAEQTDLSEKEERTEPDAEPAEEGGIQPASCEGTGSEEKIENGEETVIPATLLYQGHASVRIITGEGKVIYIDPFMGEGYDMPADLILMTHGHYDHTQEDLITERNEDCRKITWTEAVHDEEYQTFDLGYVVIESVEAGYNDYHDAGSCVGYVLTFTDGIKVYFSGDTSTAPHMADLAEKELDYAFLCCDGVYNMDADEASECAGLINARHTIPYHMVPSDNGTGFDQDVADRFDAEGKIIIRPGEELVLKR